MTTASHSASGTEPQAGRAAYLALLAALLGWMFDGAEMGVFTLIGRAAVMDLLKTNDEGVVRVWISIITAGFLVGAATGGVLFGWLGDRIGRVRAMTLSVLTYALFTGVCGFCTEAWQVGLFRFIAALGMGGEWSLGVALVMEVWPNRSRAFMAGLIGAAANVGYLIVGFVGLGLASMITNVADTMLACGMSKATVEWLTGNTGWRLIMIIGTLPALLTFFIRSFVPESEKWEKEHAGGGTTNWAAGDLWWVLVGLMGPLVIIAVWADDGKRWLPEANRETLLWIIRGVATILGIGLAVMCYAYPVLQYCRRTEAATGEQGLARRTFRRMLLAACLSGVALMGTWGSTQNLPPWADQMSKANKAIEVAQLKEAGDLAAAEKLEKTNLGAREYGLIAISAGAVLGTLIAAWLGDLLGRRLTYFVLCAVSFVAVIWLFAGHAKYDRSLLFASFIAGTCTAAFYGWLPLYLPELFATKVRATGQGFGFNFGRVLAAIGSLQIVNLLEALKGTFANGVTIAGLHIPQGWPLACCMLSGVYLVGMGIIWLAPETKGRPLPE